ncbi:MAG: hypothetical protein QF682_01880 [Candidatus Thermoplasmatota archaeon]|nr:hypothetical protein [Candidatus Thermoplasmatota archaeon]
MIFEKMTGLTHRVREIFVERRYCQWCEARQKVEVRSLTMFAESQPRGTDSAEFYKWSFFFLSAVILVTICLILVTSDIENNTDEFEIENSILSTDEPVIIGTRADESCPAGGSVNGDQEYSCGSSCHDVQSASKVILSTSYQAMSPGETITVTVRITGAEAQSSSVGVFLVTSLSSEESHPGEGGWEILSDPSGSTNFNYYLKDAVYGGGAWTWTLKAPANPGTYYLYAREHHGNGQKYWQENTNGLKFDVIETEGSGSGWLPLIYVFTGLIISFFVILIIKTIRKRDSSKKGGTKDFQDVYEDGETMIECPKCACSLKAKNRNRHKRRCTIRGRI